eukprot:g56050.t1
MTNITLATLATFSSKILLQATACVSLTLTFDLHGNRDRRLWESKGPSQNMDKLSGSSVSGSSVSKSAEIFLCASHSKAAFCLFSLIINFMSRLTSGMKGGPVVLTSGMKGGPVVCLETGEVFPDLKSAARFTCDPTDPSRQVGQVLQTPVARAPYSWDFQKYTFQYLSDTVPETRLAAIREQSRPPRSLTGCPELGDSTIGVYLDGFSHLTSEYCTL